MASKSCSREYRKTIRGKYADYKYDAKHRGIEFRLSIVEFSSFWQLPCFYCRTEIETIGLDRLDNHRGYFASNVVPCCTYCNRMRNNKNPSEFLSHCYKIVGTVENAIAVED